MQMFTCGIERSTVLVLSAVVLISTSISTGEFSSPSKPLPEPTVAISPDLCVDRIWSERHDDAKFGPGTIVHTRLRAANLPEPSVLVQLRLRDRNHALVKTVAGSPRNYVEDGHFRAGATIKLPPDEASPKMFSFPFPNKVLDLPASQSTHVVAEVLVSCDSLTNMSQGQITLMPARRLLASRAIRIIRATTLTELAPPNLNVERMEEQWWRMPARPTDDKTLSAHVEADGFRGQRLIVQVWLLRGESRVLAASDAPPEHRDDRGLFVSQYEFQVKEEHTRLPAISLPIPRKALDLPRDQNHRLRFVCSATCGGLTATWSDVIEFAASQPSSVVAVPTRTTAALPEESPHLAVTKALLAAGRIDKNRELLLAAGAGDTATVRFLLRSGADALTRGSAGLTPMHLAAASGYRDVVEALITTQADANKPPEGTSSSTERVLSTNNIFSPDFGKKPEEVDTEREAVSFEEYTEHLSFDRIIQVDAIVNAMDGQGMTPLHLAAYGGHTDTAKLLLAKNANIEASDAKGLTALHCAAMGGHKKVVAMLLESGANVKAVTVERLTPLHAAAKVGSETMAVLLLIKGANPVAKSKNGETPMSLASSKVVRQCISDYSKDPVGTRRNAELIRIVATSYVEAAASGDANTARRLVTAEVAKRLGFRLVAPPEGTSPVEHELRRLRVVKDRALATIWLKRSKARGLAREVLLTFELVRQENNWRIANMFAEPYLPELQSKEVP